MKLGLTITIWLLALSTAAGALEIRVAPAERVFLNENARRIGVYDLMLQNLAVINDGPRAVELRSIEIAALQSGDPVLVYHVSVPRYRERWPGAYDYFTRAGMMESQDSIYLFSELLRGGIKLAPTTELAPGSAVILSKRLLAFSGQPIPDELRIRASAVSSDGALHEAETSLAVIDYAARNRYILPVGGRWYVAASSSSRSHHRIRPAHEFAIDLIKIGGDGTSFRTDGTRPEDYFAFGEAVYAAAAGTVVRAVSDIPETEMPKRGESRSDFAVRVLDAMWKKDPSGRIAEGNLVVIRHAGDEHSVYVHLKQGSVRVEPGDRVEQGQLLGQVGISGDGFQPHLHFQVNNGPRPQFSRGLPVRFDNVRPVPFSSTIDLKADRMYMAGEFIETADVGR